MPMDPRMMQPQGNVRPMAGAPPGGMNPEQMLMQAAQAGDPRALEAIEMAKRAETDPSAMAQLQAQAQPAQMAPQGPPPGAQMAPPLGGPPGGVPPEAQQIMQAIQSGDQGMIQKLQQRAKLKKQGGVNSGAGPAAGIVNPPAGAEGLGFPGRESEMMEFIKQRMAEKQRVSMEEQAMKSYMMRALQEAQQPPGGGAVPMPGAGQPTAGQVGNRGRDIDAAVTAAGG